MVLSDATISRYLEEGRIEIDPYDDSLLQPSSVDVRVDRLFRVFHNNRYPYIDVKQPQDELTELVEVAEGTPFILHPGEFVLGSTLERIRLPDDLVARLEGKALSLDTPIPTPRGWMTMGSLRPGDLVFDEGGEPTVVLAATPPLVGRPCREVVFSDGTTVVCDLGHQWAVTDESGREHGNRRERIVTTAEMEGRLVVRGEWNYHVSLAGPVQYPTRDLPIDPYVLGVWLGDGTTTKADVTRPEQQIVAEVATAGYATVRQRTRPTLSRVGGTGHARDPVTGRFTSNDSLSSRLRDYGLMDGTFIPGEYLRAGVHQREALLCGLMDTDGSIDRLGRCDFTTTSETLAEGAFELVASLGFRPTVARKRAKLEGVDCGPRIEVQFTPDRPVFRLERKLARQKTVGRFHRHRAIVDVRQTSSVPVRCIQVASPRGLFLATRAFVPTHNSSLGRLGLLIHSTAGFIDPGWDGHVTLELSNVANLPITIYFAMKIGQVSFMQMTEPAATPYGADEIGSKYKGQRGPTASRYWQNFERERT